MNDSEKAHHKEIVRSLCKQSNRVFRLELCVMRHLLSRGISKEQIRDALNETRLGNLEPLTALLDH